METKNILLKHCHCWCKLSDIQYLKKNCSGDMSHIKLLVQKFSQELIFAMKSGICSFLPQPSKKQSKRFASRIDIALRLGFVVLILLKLIFLVFYFRSVNVFGLALLPVGGSHSLLFEALLSSVLTFNSGSTGGYCHPTPKK